MTHTHTAFCLVLPPFPLIFLYPLSLQAPPSNLFLTFLSLCFFLGPTDFNHFANTSFTYGLTCISLQNAPVSSLSTPVYHKPRSQAVPVVSLFTKVNKYSPVIFIWDSLSKKGQDHIPFEISILG